MKSAFWLLVPAMLLASLAACNPYTTAYGIAVDERSMAEMTADRGVKSRIIKAFANNASIEGLGFTVHAYYGDVFLTGVQDKPHQKELAVTIAEQVEGVKSVRTYILTEPPEGVEGCGFSDRMERQVEIEADLLQDMDITSTNVDAELVQCDLVLLGILGSKQEIDRVVEHARTVKGVRKVINFLRTPKR